MDLICEMGANTIRLAHYQHAQYFYDLSDERGIVVWAEIPYISKHLEKGVENTKSQMKELVYQNYNHPSIVVWGLSNEITMGGATSPIVENHKMLNDLVHSLDKTRLTTEAVLTACNINEEYVHISDVLSYNHYFGWYGVHFAEDEYRHGKQMAERGLVHMGEAIAIAHDALCGVVAQCDNSKHGNRGDDTFRSWCLSIGITKDSAYRLLQVSALMAGSSPRQRAILESLPPTLLYAVAKPSAPQELVEKVKNGEVPTNKAYLCHNKGLSELLDKVTGLNLHRGAEGAV